MSGDLEDRVREVLSHIDPSCERAVWWQICAGVKHELGDAGFAAFDEWSAGGESYSPSATRSTWRSTNEMGGKTFASVVDIAKLEGYVPKRGAFKKPTQAELEAREQKYAARMAVHEAERAHERAKAAVRAKELWAKAAARPAPADHPYLERKRIKPHVLRSGDWYKHIEGQEKAQKIENVLLVPIHDSERKLHSLEAITVDGDKLFLPGGAKKGHFCIIGTPRKDPETSQPVLVGTCGLPAVNLQKNDNKLVFVFAEGLATAISIHEATDHMVFCCLDLHNMVEVVRLKRQEHPADKVEFIIAADNDTETPGNPGMTRGTAAAMAYGARLAVPPPGDFNDLYLIEGGAEKVRKAFAEASVPTEPFVAPAGLPGVAASRERGAASPPSSTSALNVIASAASEACKDKPADVVEELNQQHAVVMVGGKVVVLRETVDERGGKELLYLSIGDFKAWHSNQFVSVEKANSEGAKTTKSYPKAELWLKSPQRRTFEGVTFAPGGNAPASHYNLWAGYAVEPLVCSLFSAAMKCRRLLSHMKYNLCSGNRAHFRYLLAWAADMLQDPDRKKGVALVMRGKKGTGKATFADVLKALLDRHAIKVAHMRHLTGNFNRHLADKLLIVAEESFWAGDKGDEGPLKDMITSPTLTVEAKGIDAVEMRSLCRVMMITNNDWAVPASTDERRYFVLDVGDRRRQDLKYFGAIQEQLTNGGLRALLTLLLQLPLNQVELRAVPETEALRAQRALSLEPHDQYVYDAIEDGVLVGREWCEATEVGKDALYNDYIDSARKRGKAHLLPKTVFAKKFMEATGAKASRLRNGAGRLQAYQMLSREEACAVFSERRGVSIAVAVGPL